MINQYKPSKPQKVKPAKPAKAAKPAKPAKAAPVGVGTATAVKIEKPKKVKTPKAPKVPKPEKAKAISFGKPGKVQAADKPIKAGKPGKLAGFFEKVDPKIILGAAIALIAVIAVVVLTVILPAVEARGQQIKHIAISSTPDKVIYLVGDEANYDGLRVLVTRRNGETFTVRAGKCEITGFDSSKAMQGQAITVNYEGFTASFYIKIEEHPQITPALAGIKMDTLPKTQYKLGEWLDTTGGVILREYVDGSSTKLTLINSDVFGFAEIKSPGTYKLTVKYMENGIIATTTYTITVTK